MAAYKFFDIKKANAEVERLEGEVARLTTEGENVAVAISAAESLRTDLTAAQTEITQLKASVAQKDSDLATVKQSLASVSTERDELKATIAKPDGEIEKRASLKAQEIVAGQGAPIVALKTSDNPTAAPEPKTWAEKAIAAALRKNK